VTLSILHLCMMYVKTVLQSSSSHGDSSNSMKYQVEVFWVMTVHSFMADTNVLEEAQPQRDE